MRFSPCLSRRTFLSGAAMMSLGLSARAFGQEFPSSNISVIIPTGEGGGADRDSRTIAQVWRNHLNSNFEFAYYPGAAGQVGYEFYMRQESDPHRLLFSNIGPEVIMLTLQDVDIEIGRDLVYFKRTSTEPMAIWVGPNSPFESMEQLVEAAKTRQVNISVSRLPHPASIGMLALGEATGAQFNLIPFGGGNPTAMAAITGEVDASALPLTNPITLGDQAHIIGVFANKNPTPAATGNAPTVNDVFGTKIPELLSSRSWAVHAATVEKYPEEMKILNQTLDATLADPDYIAAVEAAGVPREFISPGDQKQAMAEAETTRELAERYRKLLTVN